MKKYYFGYKFINGEPYGRKQVIDNGVAIGSSEPLVQKTEITEEQFNSVSVSFFIQRYPYQDPMCPG